ncbi:MAG: general secretion pathway protein GspK [Thermodesulfovibrionales bacterium]|nr:general secretion pathway protein GspK [Thermodesulfovibrionales bacterium]
MVNYIRKENGIVLVVVLFVIIILIILGLNLSYSTRFGLMSTKNMKEGTSLRYAMLGAFSEALAYIASDKDPAVDYVDEKGILHIDDREPFPQQKEYNGIKLDVIITDEEGRLNINMLNDQQLRSLLKYAGVPDDRLQIIIDSLRDWIDPDDLHRLSGAEKEYYENLEIPYRPKNQVLSVPEELLLIREFKKDYFYGSEENRGIKDFITTFSGGRLNINTVSRELMEVLGLGRIDSDTIIFQRNSLRGYRSIPPHLTALFRATSSNVFRIEITQKDSGEKIVAVIQRIPAKSGYMIKTLYWNEKRI